MSQLHLDGYEPTEREVVAEMDMAARVERAVALLRKYEPEDGYYLAFSGGKDSCVIKRLAQLAGVRFDAWYSNTTIDPPELIRFIRREHPEVQWDHPPTGNMLHRIAEGPSGVAPPTRFSRWCCREYKERGGEGRTRIFGVRADESGKRARRWSEVAEALDGFPAICPIVYWTDAQLWEFIRAYAVPYCELYDEGHERLGCVMCPLKNVKAKEADMIRWPKYATAWRKAVTANWDKWRNVPRKDGKPRFQSKFSTADEFWHWWMTDERPDVIRECQSGMLWTNEEEA